MFRLFGTHNLPINVLRNIFCVSGLSMNQKFRISSEFVCCIIFAKLEISHSPKNLNLWRKITRENAI